MTTNAPSDPALSALLQEHRRFEPPADLAARANAQPGIYEEASADPPGWWAEQARSRRAGLETLRDPRAGDEELPTMVILRADRDASYGSVRRTMATAQERGFAHFSLVVLRRRGR